METNKDIQALSDEQIKTIFLSNGFTVKEGSTDLKPYVYEAARALEAAILATRQPAPAVSQQGGSLAGLRAIGDKWMSQDGRDDLEDWIAAHTPADAAPASLFDRKLADLQQRGYEVIVRILHKEGQYALFDSSCRWLTKPQYQRLMHEQDGSLFADKSSTAQGEALSQEAGDKLASERVINYIDKFDKGLTDSGFSHEQRMKIVALLVNPATYETAVARRAASQDSERDAARLQWMCQRGACISWSMDSDTCNVWLPAERDGTERRPAEGYPQKHYAHWREAIDAAMAAPQGEKGGA